MSKNTKRILALFATAAFCATSISVSAAEWKLSGYETSDNGLGPFYQESALIYQEFDDSGFATGRTVSGTQAQEEGLQGFGKVEFKDPWVDITYPNYEYAKMFVNGDYSGRVFQTGRYGSDVVEYRSANFMWEAAAPYKIYNRTQARFASGWYTDESYPVNYDGENAIVLVTRPYYGFGDYEVTGENEFELIPSTLTAWRDAKYAQVGGGLSIADLSPKTVVNSINFTGSELKVPRLFDLFLAGPTFNYDGSIADDYGVTMFASETPSWDLYKYGISTLLTTLDHSVTGELNYCDITWTQGGYEMAPPHKTYQFLTVDGIVMDGSAIPGTFPIMYKPYIFRYVGNANPIITWRPDSVSSNNEVILRRLVDGVADMDNTTGLKVSGIFVSPQYLEVIDSETATKDLTAVYRFMYDGREYALDANGNTLVVDWSTQTATKVFVGSTYLSPYVAE